MQGFKEDAIFKYLKSLDNYLAVYGSVFACNSRGGIMRTKQWAIEDVLEELYEENRPSPEIYQRIKGGLSKLNYHELEDLRVAVILIKTRKGDTL